jgi:hypothetical protein
MANARIIVLWVIFNITILNVRVVKVCVRHVWKTPMIVYHVKAWLKKMVIYVNAKMDFIYPQIVVINVLYWNVKNAQFRVA